MRDLLGLITPLNEKLVSESTTLLTITIPVRISHLNLDSGQTHIIA